MMQLALSVGITAWPLCIDTQPERQRIESFAKFEHLHYMFKDKAKGNMF